MKASARIIESVELAPARVYTAAYDYDKVIGGPIVAMLPQMVIHSHHHRLTGAERAVQIVKAFLRGSSYLVLAVLLFQRLNGLTWAASRNACVFQHGDARAIATRAVRQDLAINDALLAREPASCICIAVLTDPPADRNQRPNLLLTIFTQGRVRLSRAC